MKALLAVFVKSPNGDVENFSIDILSHCDKGCALASNPFSLSWSRMMSQRRMKIPME